MCSSDLPMGITAFPAFGPNTVQELVALAKAGPGKVLYSTQGVGTMGHLGGELLGRLAGISMSDVPFKGTSDGMAALLGGQVHLTIDGVALYIPHIRAGRLKGIALFSDRRLPAIPNVPTVIESGYKDALASFWFGAVVPKGTPSAVVERLARAINTVMAQPEFRDRLRAESAYVEPVSAREFGRFIRQEDETWGRIIAGLKQPG